MAQYLICLSCNPKDLCVVTGAHVKRLDMVAYTCKPKAGEAETGGQSSLLNKFQASKRHCLK